MSGDGTREKIETVVIGGGQAGLSVGYHLRRQGRDFVILDANARVGDSWRHRWDSLRLFTPARFDGLAGMRFPAGRNDFVTKDQMANYLESYAERFSLPVRTSTRVERVARLGQGLVVSTNRGCIEAENVVVAMANYQQPRTPEFAHALDPAVVQLHSSAYRNPSQLAEGGVLIVGAGNSGSEIAMEVSKSHPTFMSGRPTGHVPFRIDGRLARLFLLQLVIGVVFHRVLTVANPVGRKARAGALSKGGPLIRVKPADLADAGVERVPRTVGVRDGLPLLESGRVVDATNVIWCTGFDPGFSWIDLPVFGEEEPRHQRGIVESEPGLYFVGLEFLFAMSSTMVRGVSRDAQRVAKHIAKRSVPP